MIEVMNVRKTSMTMEGVDIAQVVVLHLVDTGGEERWAELAIFEALQLSQALAVAATAAAAAMVTP